MKRHVFSSALALTVLLVAGAVGAQETADPAVRYRTADAVYLTVGRAAGLEVGQEVEVVRGDRVVAVLEVVFAAQQSASCRVLREDAEVEVGDRVRWEAREARLETAVEESPPAPAAAPAAPVSPPTEPRASRRRQASRPSPSWSGTVGVDVDSISDEGPDGATLDSTRTSARVSVRGRNLGGRPLTFRLRGRMQEIDRDRSTETVSRDRLYEASLLYGAQDTRFRFAVGRLGASPIVGIGFLDGVLGEVRLGSRFHLGLFGGSRPDMSELDFESLGERYGAYVRIHSPVTGASRPPLELVLGGVREEGDLGISREYALVELHYTGRGVWRLHQRAEVDLNNGWREELAGSATQLSRFALSASARISERRRFTLSYNRFERYRTEETRFVDEELFDDLWRQGLRGSFTFGPPRGLKVSLQAGLRSRQSGGDDSVSFGFSLRHPDLFAFSLGASAYAMAYSNDLGEGFMLSTRLSKRFGGGHSVDLSLGGRLFTPEAIDEEQELLWARVGFWAELVGRFYARGDFELRETEDVRGALTSLGVGVRF